MNSSVPKWVKVVGVALALFVAMIFVGEVVLLGTYLVLPFILWEQSSSRRFPRIAGTICGTLLLLHLFGFKFFGRPALADTETLRRPRRILALQSPNVIQFSDGSTVAVASVFFPYSVPAVNPPKDLFPEGFRMPGDTRILVNYEIERQRGIQVEVSPPTNGLSGIFFLQRASY